MTMKLYRPTPDGGLEPAPVEAKDHRRRLRSRRWDAAELANPEADNRFSCETCISKVFFAQNKARGFLFMTS